MNVSSIFTKDYDNKPVFGAGQNKAKQTQSSKSSTMKLNSILTKDYESKPRGGINPIKPSFKVLQARQSSQSGRIDKKANSQPKKRDLPTINAENEKTGEPGFGPGLTDPESVVLPLHYSPIFFLFLFIVFCRQIRQILAISIRPAERRPLILSSQGRRE